MTIKGDGDRSMDRAEWLSALADGELAAADVPTVCAEWRDDPSVQSRWHAYQLIGDVLRSDDLASTARHDSDFMASLRSRLEVEPVVLAPAPLHGSSSVETTVGAPALAVSGSDGRRRRWMLPSALAASFAAVVVGGVMMSTPADRAAPPGQIATKAPVVVPAVADGSGMTDMPVVTANGRLIRDARLDRYLAAHQQWSGGAVIGGHAAYLRQVSADAPTR